MEAGAEGWLGQVRNELIVGLAGAAIIFVGTMVTSLVVAAIAGVWLCRKE